MDKLKKYQGIIIRFLREYAAIQPANMPEVENQVVIDRENHHYQLMNVGWDGDNFIHACILHFDIKNEKIWVQANWTDLDVGEYFIEEGVPKSDIVVGFQPPEARAATGYAIA